MSGQGSLFSAALRESLGAFGEQALAINEEAAEAVASLAETGVAQVRDPGDVLADQYRTLFTAASDLAAAAQLRANLARQSDLADAGLLVGFWEMQSAAFGEWSTND